MRVRSRATTIASAVVAAAALLLAAPASASSCLVLAQGHVDVIGVAFEDGEFNVHVHDDTTEPPAEHDPADVLFHVRPQARTTVPADPRFGFLGKPGAPVWVLPQEPNPDLLFAGLGAEELEPGVFRGDKVNVRLVSVRGPGQFSLFTVDAQGAPTVLWDNGNGLPDTLSLPAGAHQHVNWAFEAQGDYALHVVVSGQLANGDYVRSGLVKYRFHVGPLS